MSSRSMAAGICSANERFHATRVRHYSTLDVAFWRGSAFIAPMRNKVLHKDEHSPVDPAVGALTDQEKSGLLSNVAASVPRCPGLSSRRVRHGSRRAVCRRPNPHPRQNTSRSRLSRVARTRMLRGVEGGRGESRPGGSNLAPLSRRGQPA